MQANVWQKISTHFLRIKFSSQLRNYDYNKRLKDRPCIRLHSTPKTASRRAGTRLITVMATVPWEATRAWMKFDNKAVGNFITIRTVLVTQYLLVRTRYKIQDKTGNPLDFSIAPRGGWPSAERVIPTKHILVSREPWKPWLKFILVLEAS